MPRDPTGSVVRNLFLLQRLGNGLGRDARELLRGLFDDIAAEMARIDPTGVGPDTYRRRRLQKLMAEVEALTGETFDAFHKRIRQDLAEIGKQQGQWAVSQLSETIGEIGVTVSSAATGINRMKAILDADPFEGLTLRQWADNQDTRTVQRVRRQIQLGMAENETLDDIVRRVRGRSNGRGGFTGGVMETTTREAEAIARTGTNFISNRAHLETYRENDDITREYEYTATLDSRTTLICANLDGRRFAYDGDSRKMPPQHFRCRSTITPVVDWDGLGVEPPPEGKRASADGPVDANTDYESWLRDQPEEVQNEVLGPARAKLFRDREASLRDMVKGDNRIVNVSDLKDE